MKLAVILGSPCGESSVTLQYVEYVLRSFPQHDFELLDVGRGMRRLERDRARFDALVTTLEAADGIIWAFPVYTFLTPAAMVRFVELLFERDAGAALTGKPCTALTSSEHFFDHTAHAWIEAVSEDLGMGVFPGFSAAMEDLLALAGQHNIERWAQEFLRAVEHDAPLEQHTQPVTWTAPSYAPALDQPRPAQGERRITVITDLAEDEPNLVRMIEAFVHYAAHPVDVVNLREIGMKGSCLGCLRCIYDGSCVYKDGFAEAFDQRIRSADVLVFAGTIRHRYLSSWFKTYFDRNFRNGHRPVLHGKPMGWILSGPLRQLPDLRRILEAKNEVQGSPRLGIVTDEYGDSAAITARIVELATRVDRWVEAPWIRPATFPGVGGRKVFRDLMYAMRGLVRADHLYYRREGLYDFPQQDWSRHLFNWAMAAMMTLPWTRRWLMKNMATLKVMGLKKIVDQQGVEPGRAH
jgi:multimeric flavodoxin WrbA